MVRKLLSLALSLTSILLPTANAFAPSTPLTQRQKTFLTPPSVTLAQSSAPFTDATTPVVQVDSNGKVFSPGSIVAIAATPTPVKAYQVPKAAFGTFDPQTRQFTPQDSENVTRGTSCLVLPEGLRGEVMKVYDVNEWDRTHPILVKFTEGSDREGEGAFGIPKTFMMHFDAHEIIVVD